MNKNVIIAALAALLIGIGIGFSMAQINRAGVVEPTPVSGSVSSEDGTAQNSESQGSSAQGSESQESSVQNSESQEPAAQDSVSQNSGSQDPEVSSDSSTTSESSRAASVATPSSTLANVVVEESGTYTSKEEVAAYIHEFGHLPSNFVTKSKAKKAGWVSKKGNLDDVLPGMSIGGDKFYNDEGILPDAPGRTWQECDINYEGGYRGAERILFSNDGLVFYTNDHYKSFEQLY